MAPEEPAPVEEPPQETTPVQPPAEQPEKVRRGSLDRRGSVDRKPEVQHQKDIEDNIAHELTELQGGSINNAFEDYTYWKPEVDHNIDELITEMTVNKS